MKEIIKNLIFGDPVRLFMLLTAMYCDYYLSMLNPFNF
jgi:hypothetical protein